MFLILLKKCAFFMKVFVFSVPNSKESKTQY